MTTFNPGTSGGIPTDATELSKAVIWAFSEAERLQPKAEWVLRTGESGRRLASTGVVVTPEHGTRFTGVGIFALDDNWKTMTGKTWEKLLTGKFITADSPGGAVEGYTPGTGGSIPSTVNTIPKLCAWMALAWQQCNQNLAIIETPYIQATGQGGEYLPAAICNAITTFDHGELLFCRVSVPILPAYASSANKLYLNGLVSSNVALGSSLTTA